MSMDTKVYTGIKELLTLSGAAQKKARRVNEEDLGLIRNAAIIARHGRVIWVGEKRNLLTTLKKISAQPSGSKKKQFEEIDLRAESVIPAFVESHTHLIFAGDRKNEFEMRNQGMSYQEIAKQGGGIRSTVKATRDAISSELLRLAQKRADNFLRQGVTTLEVKSGYGLSEKAEIKILEVAKKIRGPRIVSTYLGPHAVPEGRDADEYLDEVIERTLPKIKRRSLAERVDMFVEQNYYSLEQARRYYEAARSLGFRITGHVEQLTRTGAAGELAAISADSVDHVVQVNDQDIQNLSRSETTCVLLPTSDFYLKMNYPPARTLIDSGARIALATDFNPGTSPTQDLSFVGVLARLEMKMKLSEVIVAYTLGAAYALGRQAELGSLATGKICDFAVLDGSWRDLFYRVGEHPVSKVIVEG